MEALEVVRDLLAKSPGWSQNKMGAAVGLSSQAMSNRMKARDIKAGFLAEVLGQLGYELVALPPQSVHPAGTYVIDPVSQNSEK